VKSVSVRYFAILREERGLELERLDTAAGSVAELYDELRLRHRFTLAPGRLRAAVNDEFAPWTSAILEGDEVVFIPPVAGG
jgi:molybdopterin converting factor subunit 1